MAGPTEILAGRRQRFGARPAQTSLAGFGAPSTLSSLVYGTHTTVLP